MKRIWILIAATIAISSCSSTKNFIRYKEGPTISEKNNLNVLQMDPEFHITINKVSIDHVDNLKIKISKFEVKRESWVDFTKKLEIYDVEERNPFLGTTKRSEVDEDKGEHYENDGHKFVRTEVPFQANISAELNIKDTTLISKISEGAFYFPILKTKLDFKKISKIEGATIRIGEDLIPISRDIEELIASDYKTAHPEEFYTGKQYLEYKYKMDFCSKPSVFMTIIQRYSQFETGCIYVFTKGFQVIQSLSIGAILVPNGLPPGFPESVIILSSAPRRADGERLQNLLAEYTGLTSYNTVLGAEKTVHSFKYLGDVRLKEDSYRDDMEVAEHQD